MKKRNYKWHIFYLFCIAALAVGSLAYIMRVKNEAHTLLLREESSKALDREQLIGSIDRGERALRMAAHCQSPRVYAAKMKELAEGSVCAALLTEQQDPSSAWANFWSGLSEFAEKEIAAAVGKDMVVPDIELLDRYADILAKLKSRPEALGEALWDDLPEGLGMPHLQTEFSLGDEQLKQNAARLLNIGEGLLKKVESGIPGMVRYRVSNAEIDLLISGQLIYLDLQLPPREGSIGRAEGIRCLTDFAMQEGYESPEVVDLYENDGILWAKLAPTVKIEPFGEIKNLDCPLIAACTLWSGRICHFEVTSKIGETGGTPILGERAKSVKKLLSEKRMKKLAEERHATLGETVICKGRLCRTLVFEEEREGASVCLYLDAVDGSEQEMAFCCPPSPQELPASADREDGWRMPSSDSPLPPYAEWQRRRYRAAVLEYDRQISEMMG